MSRGIDKLSLTQLAILEAWSRGMTDRETAAELDMAVGTVKTHATKIFDRLDASTRAQAVAIWLKAEAVA